MSSPAARAEARKKAILGRSGDRLAKLTTSARGEDAPAYVRSGELICTALLFFWPDVVVDAPRRESDAFVGEEMSMPPPLPPKDTPRPSPSPPAFMAQPNPSVWSDDQQRQFMQALMGGALNPAAFPQPQSSAPPSFPPPPAAGDPLANMMAQLARMNPPQGGTAAGKAPAPPASPKPPTRLQKWMSLLHLVCMWCLLAFFVLWKEPQVFVEKSASTVEVAFWKRWPKLVTQGTLEGVWGVQFVVSGLGLVWMSRSLRLCPCSRSFGCL